MVIEATITWSDGEVTMQEVIDSKAVAVLIDETVCGERKAIKIDFFDTSDDTGMTININQ
ncbi:MAG: hypothetical protein V3T23_03895 [Nitrososphaerales archaeon]